MTTADLLAPKKRRARARKPAWTFAGLTADQWRADSARVHWAQTDGMFKDVLTVMTNARKRALAIRPGTSENRQLGLVEGFELALEELFSLAQGGLPPTAPPPTEDYAPDN